MPAADGFFLRRASSSLYHHRLPPFHGRPVPDRRADV